MREKSPSIAVIGLGAVGSATLYHLAKAGVRVIGFDQHSPPHTFGSSHGETRITRLSIGEGAHYIPLVRRSHELWRILESETDAEILKITGGLIIGSTTGSHHHGVSGFAQNTIKLAQTFSIPHEVLSVKEAKLRFPEFNLNDDAVVYFEPGAGFIRPEAAIESHLKLAENYGAEIFTNERVRKIDRTPKGTVSITTDLTTIEVERCILSVGSWIKPFMPPETQSLFKICRQVLHWMPITSVSYSLKSSPIFIWCYGAADEDLIYGFPSLDGSTIKIASESYVDQGAPGAIDRSVSIEEQASFFNEKISNRLKNIGHMPVKSVVCQYTTAPNSQFIIDYHPEIPEALIASCCSGHGFKHSAALGEALADEIVGEGSNEALTAFRRNWKN